MPTISKKIEADLTQCMLSMGFTNYEAKIMHTLYQIGSLKADQIAEYASIPLSRVYDGVEGLIRKGFVAVSNSRPRVYSAVPPSEASNAFVEKTKEKFAIELKNIKTLTRQFVEIVQPLFLKNYTQIEPENLITQLNSLEDAERRTIEIIEKAKKEVCIFTHIFNWYEKVKDSLFKVQDRGVRIRILLQSEEDEHTTTIRKELEERGAECKIHLDDSIKTRGTIVDGKTLVFVMWVTQEGTLQRKIFKPQFSINPGIVRVFQNNFDYLWENTR